MDRQKLLASTQMLLCATALTMAILVVTGMVQVWHLFLFTLITGIGWAFNQPVRQALVPAVVPKEDLSNAIALSSMAFNITKVVAPTMGGLLIAWFGAGGNFFVQAATYLLVLATVYQIRLKPVPARVQQSSAFVDLKEGLKYVGSNRLMLALIVCALVPQVFAMPYQTLMPIFQKDVLGVGPEGLGMLLAAPGVGAVPTMLLFASVAHRFHRKGLILLGALILWGTSLILFSQATSFPLAMAALVCVGSCQILFNITSMTMLQLLVPDAFRGRVVSIYMLDHGLQPAGAFLAGVTTSFVGAPLTISMMGLIVILLAVLVGWRVPRLREVEA
jgi:MFS family permease